MRKKLSAAGDYPAIWALVRHALHCRSTMTRTRKQFDRPIGSFQAVKHACAEMMIEIYPTRVAVMFAAMSAADPDELAIAAPLVKAQAADKFALCAGSANQVHGGIAFTWEHDLHLYYRRAKTTAALFGSSAHHRAPLADRVGP
jgi:alkylation response protein AidB-like acyl-CoA dehydrogenase